VGNFSPRWNDPEQVGQRSMELVDATSLYVQRVPESIGGHWATSVPVGTNPEVYSMTPKNVSLHFLRVWCKNAEFYSDFKSFEIFGKSYPLKKLFAKKHLPNSQKSGKTPTFSF
jgi:hypothetical protein